MAFGLGFHENSYHGCTARTCDLFAFNSFAGVELSPVKTPMYRSSLHNLNFAKHLPHSPCLPSLPSPLQPPSQPFPSCPTPHKCVFKTSSSSVFVINVCVLDVPLALSFLVLIILAAYSWPVHNFTHRRTTEKAPLEEHTEQNRELCGTHTHTEREKHTCAQCTHTHTQTFGHTMFSYLNPILILFY